MARYRKPKKPPKKQRELMAKRAKAMRKWRQTFHEGVTQFVLGELCKEIGLTLKNQKIFYNSCKKKWYIADFFIPEIGLVIEVDGASHKGREAYDATRTEFIKSLGHDVIRIKNEECETLDYSDKLKNIIIKQMVRVQDTFPRSRTKNFRKNR